MSGQIMETVQTGQLEEDIFGSIIGGELDIKTDIKKNENFVNNMNTIDGGPCVDNYIEIEIGGVNDQSVRKMNDIEDLECTFKRGVCVKHKLKGNKMTLNSKKWGEKKNGTYGWIHRKKVVFKCIHKSDELLSVDMKSDASSSLLPVDFVKQQQQDVANLFQTLNGQVRDEQSHDKSESLESLDQQIQK